MFRICLETVKNTAAVTNHRTYKTPGQGIGNYQIQLIAITNC
nr:MAG TPA_asm: hypothetical protein [Caudoviricetes sp.]